MPLVPGGVLVGGNTIANIIVVSRDFMLLREERINTPS
jgi:hypothetical protein